jgi:hypothetical protein
VHGKQFLVFHLGWRFRHAVERVRVVVTRGCVIGGLIEEEEEDSAEFTVLRYYKISTYRFCFGILCLCVCVCVCVCRYGHLGKKPS